MKAHFLQATVQVNSKPVERNGIQLPETPSFYKVQLKFEESKDTLMKALRWIYNQSAFTNVKIDHPTVKIKPCSNKDNKLDRHVIICEGIADPEWVLAEGVQVYYALPCNCGNKQRTCVNGKSGCLDGKLEGENHE